MGGGWCQKALQELVIFEFLDLLYMSFCNTDDLVPFGPRPMRDDFGPVVVILASGHVLVDLNPSYQPNA